MAFPAVGSQLGLLVLFSRSVEFRVGANRKWGIAKPRIESRPGMEYKLWEGRIQTSRLSWVQAPEGGSKLLRPERVGDSLLFPSGVRTFRRLDGCLLVGLVDSSLPVLCAPFFTSCEAIEFAETGHRREEHPYLPVGLLMVHYASGSQPFQCHGPFWRNE